MDQKIITLCGSTRFKETFYKVAEELTKKGYIVLYPSCYNHSENNENKYFKELLCKTHRKMIDMSDAIYVINKDGYIGESTKSEIEYAIQHNKEVIYFVDHIKITKYKYHILHKIDNYTYLMIKDIKVSYDPNVNNPLSDKIKKVEAGCGGGCIWGNGLMTMASDHPRVIEDNEKYGLIENIQIMLGWDTNIFECVSPIQNDDKPAGILTIDQICDILKIK